MSLDINDPALAALLQGDAGAAATAAINGMNVPGGYMMQHQVQQQQQQTIRDYLSRIDQNNLARMVFARQQQMQEREKYLGEADTARAGQIAPNALAGVDSNQVVPLQGLITPDGRNPATSSIGAAALGKRFATSAVAQEAIAGAAEKSANAGMVFDPAAVFNPANGVIPNSRQNIMGSLPIAKAIAGQDKGTIVYDKDGNVLTQTMNAPGSQIRSGAAAATGGAATLNQPTTAMNSDAMRSTFVSSLPESKFKQELQRSGNGATFQTKNVQDPATKGVVKAMIVSYPTANGQYTHAFQVDNSGKMQRDLGPIGGSTK